MIMAQIVQEDVLARSLLGRGFAVSGANGSMGDIDTTPRHQRHLTKEGEHGAQADLTGGLGVIGI